MSLLKYEEDAGLKIDVRLLIDEILFSLVFVEKNIEKELHYNHYSKNLIAIYVAKSVLGIDICQSFKNELKYSISHQVNADGMQAELSPMYNLLFLNDLKILCSIKGCDESLNRFFLETYDRIEVVAKLFFYNKNNLSVIGDSWVGEAARNFSVLNGNVTSILRDSGYLIHHSEKISFIFDFGKAGARSNPGHSHSDFLHTELYVNNNPVFVDYGVPTYSQGALRDYSRSSFAHNGPAIMESSLLETWSSFRTGRESSTSLVKYDKSGSEFEIKAIVRPFFRRKLQLSREIKYSKDALCIRDSWDAQMLDGFTPYLQFIVPKKSLMEFDSIESLSESNSIFLLDGWVIHFLALSIQFTECSYYSRYGIAENGIAIRITPKDYGTLKVSELHLVYGNK